MSKHVFWQALVFTVIVFASGLVLGYFLEVSRSEEINLLSLDSELNLVDQQLQARSSGVLNISCQDREKQLFSFADSIYNDASQLEEYDRNNLFSPSLTLLHKRYDLLRILLWFEALDLREDCDLKFHRVVYLYDYGIDEIDLKAKQKLFSRALLDLKYNHPDEILLIPIAHDSGLESTRIINERFSIKKSPAIVVDEAFVIYEINDFKEFEKVVLESNK